MTLLDIFDNWHAELGSGKEEKSHQRWCLLQGLNYRALQQADLTFRRICSRARKIGISLDSIPPSMHIAVKYEKIGRALCSGYFQHASICFSKETQDAGFLVVGNGLGNAKHPAKLHPATCQWLLGQYHQAGWIIYHSAFKTEYTYLHTVTHIRPEWLLTEHARIWSEDIKFDPATARASVDKV